MTEGPHRLQSWQDDCIATSCEVLCALLPHSSYASYASYPSDIFKSLRSRVLGEGFPVSRRKSDTTTRSPAVVRGFAERTITDNASDFPGLLAAIDPSIPEPNAVHNSLEGAGSAAHDVGMIGASTEGER